MYSTREEQLAKQNRFLARFLVEPVALFTTLRSCLLLCKKLQTGSIGMNWKKLEDMIHWRLLCMDIFYTD